MVEILSKQIICKAKNMLLVIINIVILLSLSRRPCILLINFIYGDGCSTCSTLRPCPQPQLPCTQSCLLIKSVHSGMQIKSWANKEVWNQHECLVIRGGVIFVFYTYFTCGIKHRLQQHILFIPINAWYYSELHNAVMSHLRIQFLLIQFNRLPIKYYNLVK